MKHFLALTALFMSVALQAQQLPEEFGFRHYESISGNDTAHILVQSMKGEEHVKKPLFFFCQGSLPVPLIVTSKEGPYGTFPFSTDALCKKYHLVIVGKPGVPLIAADTTLAPGFVYLDPSTGKMPAKYTQNNLPEFYVARNLRVLHMLGELPFATERGLVVAGHSQGASVAARMAAADKTVSRLIFASGNPMGQIMSMMGAARAHETDSTQDGEMQLRYWSETCAHKTDLNDEHGDTYRSVYDFSEPSVNYLRELKIPVLVSYGTIDYCTPFIDYMRVDFTRSGKENFTYNAYVGRNHNFFGMQPDGRTDHSDFGWDIVVADWMKWLEAQE
jgi:pimeloyl-ACP methyl ester carboxylesterase